MAIIDEVTNVSRARAFYSQTLPTNTTAKILAKVDDDREGLLGIANDAENYGDLYVVGNDGKAHLTKSGIKSEVIFDGVAGVAGSYTLGKSISTYKYLVVYFGEARNCVSVSNFIDVSQIDYSKYAYQFGCSAYADTTYSMYVDFGFKDEFTLYINSIITNTWGTGRIYRIVGIY